MSLLTRRVYLECVSGETWKYWALQLVDMTITVRWGRIGYAGRACTYQFDSVTAARRAAARKIQAKRRRGYHGAVEGVRRARPARLPTPPPPHPDQLALSL